ncbi:MAG: nucleotidyltransferase family protein [Chloroflexota bacterium]
MISAIVLAAGQSKRMGQPKMLLPWGGTTILAHIVEVLRRAEVEDIVVVTGAERARIEESLANYHLRITFNPGYANDDLLTSIQCGIAAQLPGAQAALICLGDQPQVQERSVRLVCETFRRTQSNLVVPSYQMRRGHPWLVARTLWNELLEMKSLQTPRDLLNAHANEIEYVNVDTPSVIEDLDTPADYLKFKP